MRNTLTIVLVLAIAASGCATARGQVRTAPAYRTDPALMSTYVRQLPVGSRVRVSLADGRVVKGTLIKADADPIVVQRRTRIPEPPMHIAIADLYAVEIDKPGGGPGRSIAIGAAAGAGAALATLLLLVAVFSD